MYSKKICSYLLLFVLAACSKPAEPVFDNPIDPENDNTVTLTDIDGNSYETVQIGDQIWMAENLKTSRYRDGSTIPNVTDSLNWFGLTSGAWAYYNNNSSNDNIYGKLYNWHAANDSRGLCPSGWSVPRDQDWQQLEIHLGMSTSEASIDGDRGESQNIGGKLKATGTQYWTPPNEGATNESGFSALPGGLIFVDFSSAFIGEVGEWWTSTQNSTNSAWVRTLYSDVSSIQRWDWGKTEGKSIRCIRN